MTTLTMFGIRNPFASKTLNHERLTKLVRDAAEKSFSELQNHHPSEEFYGFTINPTSGYESLGVVALGEQGLRKAAKSYNADDPESASEELRWSLGDSPYWANSHFREVDRYLGPIQRRAAEADDDYEDYVQGVRRCCIAALKGLDQEGLFGEGDARTKIALNVLVSDFSNRILLDGVKELNPAATLARVEKEAPVAKAVGSYTTLSENTYQVDDVAVSSSAIALAAGRLEVWQGQQRAFMKPGNFSTVDANSDTFVAAQEGEVLLFSAAGEKARWTGPFAKPKHVRISRNGLVAVSDFENVVVVLRNAEVAWRAPLGAAALAINSDAGLIAISTWSDGVGVHDLATGEKKAAVGDSKRRCDTIAWLGSDVLLGGDVDFVGFLELWSLDEGKLGQFEVPSPLEESAGHKLTGCHALAVGDGRIASAHGNGELHIWSSSTLALEKTVRGTHESLDGCAWVTDTQVAAVGRDVDEAPALWLFDV